MAVKIAELKILIIHYEGCVQDLVQIVMIRFIVFAISNFSYVLNVLQNRNKNTGLCGIRHGRFGNFCFLEMKCADQVVCITMLLKKRPEVCDGKIY